MISVEEAELALAWARLAAPYEDVKTDKVRVQAIEDRVLMVDGHRLCWS